MEADGASAARGTSTPPAASSPAPSGTPNGSTPGTPETSSTLTQKEILRERYLKGVKKRKCAVCGNTARARCPFRSCKTCCLKAKNVCEIHANKPKQQQAPSPPVLDHNDPHWAAAVNAMPYGPAYVRPPYMTQAAYNAAQAGMGEYRVGFVAPQSRPSAPGHTYMPQNARPYLASPATLEQQELQRLRNFRTAQQAALREAQISNTWRTQKMRDFVDAEVANEDEAFDRYMFNMALLEEVFIPKALVPSGLSAHGELCISNGESAADADKKDISDTLMVVDGLHVRRGTDATWKEASRTRLRSVVGRGSQFLKKGQQEVEEFVEDEDYYQAPILGRRWDLKRFKTQTKEGKDCLKRIELFETLLQKTNQIHSKADIDSCAEMYRQNFGKGLDVLLPHLSGKVHNLLDAQVRRDTASTTTSSGLRSEALGKEASTSGNSQPMLDEADQTKTREAVLEESARSINPSIEVEVKNLLQEQARNSSSMDQAKASTSEGKTSNAMAGDTTHSRSKSEVAADWPRLHHGFLAGHGWWKVEVDEQSAQIACQHLLNSDQAVQVL